MMAFISRTSKFIFSIAVLNIFLFPHVQVNAQPAPPEEPYKGETLCSPDAYPVDPQDCLPLGPSTALTDLAKKGIIFPPVPLATHKPDRALNDLPVKYAKINVASTEPAPIYGSLDDAITGTNPKRYLAAGNGLRYVTYQSMSDANGGHYVMLPGGEWKRASPASTASTFQGLLIDEMPRSAFGWIIETTYVHTAPSVQSTLGEHQVAKEDVVQIYNLVRAEGTEWYQIGMNEWVDRHYIRQLELNPTPPKRVENNRWIEVNLYEQTLSVYDNGKLVFVTLIASGVKPYYTRPGLFKLYKKKELENMSGAFESDKSDYYYLGGVPWTMYFDEARALHGAYWRAWFGIPQSHGCVNLSVGDAHWLFNWAHEGDWVYVWDPSGQTPVDPKFYGQGGA
jgi:lipoprotein-anchoring transpeptidase ErfK/SrfK